MYHLDHQTLLKILVVISTAVVIVYLSAIGYLDLSGTQVNALTPAEAGSALLTQGNYQSAIDLYQKQIVSLNAGLVEANLGLARAYQGSNQLGNAEAIYRRVIRLQKSTKDAYVGLSRVLIDEGKFTDARTELKAGLQLFPADVDLLKLEDEAQTASE